MDVIGNINENSPLLPSNDPYCDTKLEAENIVLEYARKGLKAVIVQPTQVYGPGDEKWTMKPIRLIKSGMMIYPDGGRGLLQPLYIDDLIDGIILATLYGKKGQSYILCGNEVITVKEFFGYYTNMVGRSSCCNNACHL
ncbi:MAG: NAD-dependent epimerase/dehydratase family protein [Nitrospirota bacterium]